MVREQIHKIALAVDLEESRSEIRSGIFRRRCHE
jgi:hypothetical protein